MAKSSKNKKKTTLDDVYLKIQQAPSYCYLYDGKPSFFDERDEISKTIIFNLYTQEDDNPIAMMELVLFEVSRVGKYDWNIAFDMDSMTAEFGAIGFSLYDYFLKNDSNRQLVDLKEFKNVSKFVDVHMRTLFVYPEYRNCGIGTYLLENISRLLYAYNRMIARMITTIPEPIDYTDENCPYTHNEKMKEIMIDHIVHHGFFPTDESQTVFIKEDDYRIS